MAWLNRLHADLQDGRWATDQEVLYRSDEPRLEIQESGRSWAFDADPALFRLVSEALRIRLAHLFDPYLAVHTSNLEPLPHQIRAVYGEMLPRQPLRFLLADDPGAGKTIMAGLLIKELIVRGDLQAVPDRRRPGAWWSSGRTSLQQKLGLEFEHRRPRGDRGVAQRQPVRRARTSSSPSRSALAQRGRSGEARADRLGPGRRRRGAQDVGALLRIGGQGDRRATGSVGCWAGSRGTCC